MKKRRIAVLLHRITQLVDEKDGEEVKEFSDLSKEEQKYMEDIADVVIKVWKELNR